MSKGLINSLRVLIAIIMVALLFVGIFLAQVWLVITSIILLFSLEFLLAVIVLVRMGVKAKKSLEETKPKDQKEQEEKEIAEVNSTCYLENSMAQGTRMMKHSAKAWKYSSTKERILGMLFLFTFIGCAIGAVVAGNFNNMVLSITFWALGVGIILIAILSVVIKQKVSMSRAKKYLKQLEECAGNDLDQTIGVVKASILSSESSVGSHRQRIVNTTYKIVIDVNGSLKEAYSKTFYNEGEVVKVVFKHGSNLVAILDKVESNQSQQELENINYTIENSSKIEETNQTEYNNEIEELYKEMENLDDYSEIEDFNFDDDFNEDNNEEKKKGQK